MVQSIMKTVRSISLQVSSSGNCILISFIDICLPTSDQSMDNLIDRVYPQIHTINNLSESDRRIYFSERVILAALNSDVDGLNDAYLNRLSGDSMTYLSIDTALDEGGNTDYNIYP
jgi:PIF1-like helicase